MDKLSLPVGEIKIKRNNNSVCRFKGNQLAMACNSIFLFLLSSLLAVSGHSAEEELRSAQLTVMNGWQFQCANTICVPVATNVALNIEDCASACLSEVQYKPFTFRETAAICEILTKVQSRTSNTLVNVDSTTMIIMDRTRVPPGQYQQNTVLRVGCGSKISLDRY